MYAWEQIDHGLRVNAHEVDNLSDRIRFVQLAQVDDEHFAIDKCDQKAFDLQAQLAQAVRFQL
jgi:hypothetical protein